MLSNAASPQQHAKQQSLPTKRRVTVPKQLNFLERCPPEAYVWERLDPERRNLIIEALASLVARAALANITQEQYDDR